MSTIVDLQIAQRRRETQRQNQQGMAARPFHLTCEVKVNGIGDSAQTVQFGTKFMNKPMFSPGWDTGGAAVIQMGYLPTLTAGVMSWELEQNQPDYVLYTGATLAVTTTGPVGTVFYLHCHFVGVAFVNPMTQLDPSLESTI